MSTNAAAMPRRQVAQAAGMVSVQADCFIEHAFLLMDARAELADVTLDEVAEAVIDRTIRFD